MPLLDWSRMSASPALSDPRSAARIARARADMRTGTFSVRLASFAVCAWLLFVVLSETRAGGFVWITVLAMATAVGLFVNRYAARVGTNRRARRVAETLARHGLCPSCAYELRSIEAGPDGNTVCPECGGAWIVAFPLSEASAASTAEPLVLRQVPRFRVRFGSVKDDRGNTLAAVRVRPAELLDAPWTPERRQRVETGLRNANAATRRARRWMGLMHACLLTLLAFTSGYAIYAWVTMMNGFGPAGAIPLWLSVSLLAFPAAVLLHALAHAVMLGSEISGRTSLDHQTGRRALIGTGFCGACFTDLSGVRPDPDGCTPCPECGAAWRLDPRSATADPPAP